MIELTIKGCVENLHEDSYVDGISLSLKNYSDDEVGITIGSEMTIVSKSELIHMIKSLEC